MRHSALLMIVSLMVLPAEAKRVTVAQLEQILVAAADARKSDTEIVRQIGGLELSECDCDHPGPARFSSCHRLTSSPRTTVAGGSVSLSRPSAKRIARQPHPERRRAAAYARGDPPVCRAKHYHGSPTCLQHVRRTATMTPLDRFRTSGPFVLGCTLWTHQAERPRYKTNGTISPGLGVPPFGRSKRGLFPLATLARR
jgi:hypothetical protein